MTPLLTAIGLPAEGVGVLIAVDLIPDMFATVINVTGDVTATALVARLSRDDVVAAAPPVPAAGAA
ncbi:MAG: cation:dicarboxylase symporter family transporter [Gemmatimonadetes bacterium]|nr:cation:dicarboxylase symporter family transporter [Gemmatimonadota bacterium]